MVSRKQSEVSDVRGQVLDAATRLFARAGFDGTSLQAIADEVGVTKQAVLHHFASKEDLRRAVLEGLLAHWNKRLPELLLAATAGEDRFDAVLGELVRFFTEKPDRARLVVREVLDRPDEIRALMRGPVHKWLEAIGTYVRAGQQSGAHQAGLDANAYLVMMLQLVITTAATERVMGAALGDGANGSERLRTELFRMARAALFSAQAAPVVSTSKTNKTRTRTRGE